MPGGRHGRPRIDDDELRRLFEQGDDDARIAERLDAPGVDAHYVFKRRMALRLLRRPGAPRGHRKANRHGTHGIAGKGFSVPAFDNPAFVERRTLYPSTVRDPGELTNLLVSGAARRSLGGRRAAGRAGCAGTPGDASPSCNTEGAIMAEDVQEPSYDPIDALKLVPQRGAGRAVSRNR